MENVVWGEVPAQRKRKEEKFNFPAVTMSAIDKPGAGRKFSFNKAAQEALDIKGEERVSFGFATDTKQIFVRKATGEAGFQLTKTCTLSDKRTYEFIAKRLDLNSEVENTFSVNMIAGQNYGELVLTTIFTTMVEDAPTGVANAFDHGIDTAIEHDANDVAEYVEPVAEIEDELVIPQPTEEVLDFDLDTIETKDESSEEDVW
jgi:hypothetical protein